jgi:O-antigen ligase
VTGTHEPAIPPPAAPGIEPGPQRPPAAPLSARLLAAALALAAIAVVLVSVPSRLFDLDRHSVPKELVVHAAGLLSLLWLLHGRRPPRAGIVEVLLAAFVAWTGLSALLAENRWISVRVAGLTYSAFLVFLSGRRLADEGAGRLALGGLGLAAILGAAIGAAQAYGLNLDWLTDDRPPGGTFGNRNFLAHFGAISTPLLLLLALRARRPLARTVWHAGLAVAACAIVLTRSRAGWLGLGAGLGVFGVAWLLARRETRAASGRGLRRAAVVIVVGGLAAIVVPNRLEWRSDAPYAETLTRLTDYRTGSGRGRLIQYENSLRLARDHPVLGVGPGNWFVHYPRVTTRGDRAFSAGDPIPTNPWPSSDWVALLAERGVLAALLALGAAGAAILVSLRRLRDEDGAVALAAMAVPATLAAAFVTGAFDAVLMLAPPAFFVALTVGLLLPPTRPIMERRLEGRRRTVLATLMLAAAVAVLLLDTAQLAAIRITRDSSARSTVERALRYDPGNYRLRLLLAGRGSCRQRLEHARVAARLLPYHAAPRSALRACGG